MFIFNLLPECRWSEVTVAESEQDKVLARGMDSQPSPSTWCKSRHTFTINQENPTQTDRKVTFPRWTFLYKSKWIVIASNTMIITTVVSHQTWPSTTSKALGLSRKKLPPQSSRFWRREFPDCKIVTLFTFESKLVSDPQCFQGYRSLSLCQM